MGFMPKNQLNLHWISIFKLNKIQFFHLYSKLFSELLVGNIILVEMVFLRLGIINATVYKLIYTFTNFN
jgi:hypothetical protein